MDRIHPADTNFAVTGAGRSGTTYMMRCLEAGGLAVAKETWRYELRSRGNNMDFDKYKGRCVKILSDVLAPYDSSNLAVIFMKRNPHKIVASYIRFNGRIPYSVAECVRTNRGWKVNIKPYDQTRKVWAAMWRKDARSYIECQLEGMDTYDKRIKFFTALKAQGWPIDPRAAALVENDEKSRIAQKGRKVGWT